MASKIICPFWQVWGLGFSAWQHRVESWQVFALKSQSVNQYCTILYYLYVLDRHFEWLSLSFVLSNIPSPRTDLASGEHWPAITDHGVIRDLNIHENDWTNLNQKKKSGKIRECFFSFMLFSRERYTVIQSYPSIPTITHRRKPPQNRHRAVLQPLLMWAYHPGDRNDTELFFLLPSGRNNIEAIAFTIRIQPSSTFQIW